MAVFLQFQIPVLLLQFYCSRFLLVTVLKKTNKLLTTVTYLNVAPFTPPPQLLTKNFVGSKFFLHPKIRGSPWPQLLDRTLSPSIRHCSIFEQLSVLGGLVVLFIVNPRPNWFIQISPWWLSFDGAVSSPLFDYIMLILSEHSCFPYWHNFRGGRGRYSYGSRPCHPCELDFTFP